MRREPDRRHDNDGGQYQIGGADRVAVEQVARTRDRARRDQRRGLRIAPPRPRLHHRQERRPGARSWRGSRAGIHPGSGRRSWSLSRRAIRLAGNFSRAATSARVQPWCSRAAPRRCPTMHRADRQVPWPTQNTPRLHRSRSGVRSLRSPLRLSSRCFLWTKAASTGCSPRSIHRLPAPPSQPHPEPASPLQHRRLAAAHRACSSRWIWTFNDCACCDWGNACSSRRV